jgi:hypothetical protein
MIWVKLTTLEDVEIFVNLEKYDFMLATVDEDGVPCTKLCAMIGEDDEEVYEVAVKQTPQEIFKMEREI